MNITYLDSKGNRTEVKGKVGDNLMYLAHRYDIPMEGKKSIINRAQNNGRSTDNAGSV